MPTIEFFRGKRILNFSTEANTFDPKNIYRLGVNWDTEEPNILNQLNVLAEQERLDEVTSLIIGLWELEDDGYTDDIINKIVEIAPKLPNLTGLFWGDISYEENEISWIINSNVTPLIQAFPKLEYFKARGGNELRFENLKHDTLKTLKVETGGLGNNAIKDIIQADLPNLETLNIWFGSSYYGFEASVDDIKPLIVGTAYPEMKYPFPKLKELGLCNCELADDLAEAMVDGKSLFDTIKALDMSMGTMTDRGVEALIENNMIGQLKKIDLSSNFIKDSSLIEQLKAKGVKVTLGAQKEPYNEGDYYVDVSE